MLMLPVDLPEQFDELLISKSFPDKATNLHKVPLQS